MNASKENCQKALTALENIRRGSEDFQDYWDLQEFLEVALRKLPHERSFLKKTKLDVENKS